MKRHTNQPITWAGPALIIIGLLHSIVMVAVFHEPYLGIITAGWFNTVNELASPLWGAAFWALLFGFMLILVGLLLPGNRQPIPKSAALTLLLVILIGITIMPSGGFWLGLPVAIGLIQRG